MISNPNLMFYACISKGNTILAEFNSKDADLGDLAAKCIGKTPPLHTTFSHTVRKRTYTFFIDHPFAYFAISDDKLENPEILSFLRSVKEAFNRIVIIESNENFNSRCFQGEFNQVFHKLLSANSGFEGPNSPPSPWGTTRHDPIGPMPLLGGDISKSLKKVDISKSVRNKNKSKKRFTVESNGDGNGRERMGENKVDLPDAVVLSREFSIAVAKNGLLFGGSDSAHQKAKRVWKKHVWVVLSLDLIVCSVLFGVWLWICRGFKCIDG